jgi:ribulose-phosphate 3-epimerase
MGVIVPAILPTSKKDLDATISRFIGIASSVQIDVVDGKFAQPACWPYLNGSHEFAEMVTNEEMLPGWGQIKFDIDLMVNNPEEVVGSWITLGASRITIHAESTRYLDQLLGEVSVKYGHDKDFAPDLLSLGLAIDMATDMAVIEPYISKIDYVQFMGIAKIGRQGEPFDARVIERIRQFRTKYPDTPIQVDGGVTAETAPTLLAAGVSRLIVGHALMEARDVAAQYNLFVDLAQQYGLYEV